MGFGMSVLAREDYRDFLIEQGTNDVIVRAISEVESDRVDLYVDYITVKKSDIEGVGLFALKPISRNNVIMLAVRDGFITQAGRYTNHSNSPNAVMSIRGDGDIELVAIDDLIDGDEITTDYRATAELAQAVDTSASHELIKDDIAALEVELLNSNAQVDLPLSHHFADSVYGREMFVPAGVAFTGKIHKTRHISILASGSMMLASTTGGVNRMDSPCIFVSPPNTKKAGFAITDCVFLTVHGTDETDLNKLEAELVSDDYIGGEA